MDQERIKKRGKADPTQQAKPPTREPLFDAAKQASLTHVPGQYLGYSLQTTRLAYRLLQSSPGDTVCLECFADVGVELASGERIAEEDKSTQGDNPVSDRAEQLWKTLFNWVCEVEATNLSVTNTWFELYVSTSMSGPIVSRFSMANSAEEARSAVDFAMETLWGAPPSRNEKDSVASSISRFVDTCFNKRDILEGIVRRFRLVCSLVNPIADIVREMESKFVSEGSARQMTEMALGWVKAKTDEMIQAGQAARVQCEDFRRYMVKLARRIDRETILRGCSHRWNDNALASEVTSDPLYISQLRCIGLSYDSQLLAARNCLSATNDRIEWGRNGDISDNELEVLERELETAWATHSLSVEDEYSDRAAVVRGRITYQRCMLERKHLAGLEVPDYFCPGTFHHLADVPNIWWHPDKIVRNVLHSDESEDSSAI